ncbi:uncharacterized protein LAESUDRAFT_745109 [Laetiporus sulphureus 93-53]|uniref:Cytochrome c oxidase assembly protein COX16, mitochondrial n=1 Tax=Laetiporus sulphureus 93-53 TaxID=1314785 RepID=A0A165C8D7_9APHY|nr:uncharacterized protein LAESUDRAFT_745109 [Laetiporus sulphureus 93-53]KZT02378.1 hypothetical protein LAESUDRAFT_745109 [Laetiporus sulphureus 93-53]
MAVFPSRPLKSHSIHALLRKHPSVFGIPFLMIIVGASFAMQGFTQTRYDLHAQKVSQLNKEQELGLRKSRKKFDIREEYYRLSTAKDDDWEIIRVPRPKGLPEWGVPPPEPPANADKA